jgi:outer membrane protein assembly factor BamB
VRLDGAVYASPLVVRGTVIAATEHDSVYGLSLAGAVRWRTELGSPSPGSERPCGNIDPLGITGTPVYDPSTGSVFVVAEYGHPVRHELVALDQATGAVRWRRELDLPGVNATVMQQRAALALDGGRVWVAFGGLAGDCGNYKGRVIGIPTSGSGDPAVYTVPTRREAGIWTPPGPVVDATGTMFVSVGNGAAEPGDRYDLSDSVLALDSSARLVDSFAPRSWAADNASDSDLGSQGPALVGPWILIVGKSGTAYVLRRGHLGGIGGEVSSTSLSPSYGGTAVSGDVVYLPCTDGLRAVRVDGAGAVHQLWQARASISGSPVVGGGRVWSLNTSDGVLHALNPANGRSEASVHVGAVSRFATPAIGGAVLYVPTLSGIAIVQAG